MKNNASESKGGNINQGRLFVVATPIGNLGDISRRAIHTLSSVDIIACEETRHTKKLCRHFNISTPLVSYYREREQEKSEALIKLMCAGKQIALVSDAGTPALCDPGALLVQKARSMGIAIEAVSGPSALTTALSIAGLTQSSFFFGGFLPANPNERRRSLKEVASLPFVLVFYESPHRIQATLADMETILSNRHTQIFRELTKIHEECLEGPLATLAERLKNGVKGELVLVVHPAKCAHSEHPDNIDDLLLWYRDELQSSLKDAVSNVASTLDLPRSHVYKKALLIWQHIE
jgi:16S rRNA (cytidine1402-2'-O)-methyltransferase